MRHEKFDNVWFALEANEADAINMTLRSDLMTSIERSVAAWNLSQAEAANTSASPAPASTIYCAAKSASLASIR
jgi:predicted XRE-type DNA-binding protein